MLNRRHIRIKTLQVLFAFYSEENADIVRYEKMLFESFDRYRDLYVALLSLLPEMQHKAIEKIEAGMNKKLPAKEDLHPNTKFVTNHLLRILSNSKVLTKAEKDNHIKWRENPDLLKSTFKLLVESEDYVEYMNSKERGFNHDREYLIRMFKRQLINFEIIHEWLEDIGIFWNDDLDLASSMVIRSLKQVSENDDDVVLMPLWKPEDDEEAYTKTLFRKTLTMGEESEKVIQANSPNWDMDRIALMDLIILKMAIAEATSCDSIPIKVTINEYIEVAKYYSTDKSTQFINGLLDVIIPKLQEEGKIKKIGRGLIDSAN
jgi:transcription antitermination protein NusB